MAGWSQAPPCQGAARVRMWVPKRPCSMTAASLKINSKQTKKAAAQHGNHPSSSLTSLDTVKLGGKNQQKVFGALNSGEKSCTCAGGELGSQNCSGRWESRGGRRLLLLSCCRSLRLLLLVWFQLRLVQHGADAGVPELSAVAHQPVSAELWWCWGCRGGAGELLLPPDLSGWQDAGGSCGFSSCTSGVAPCPSLVPNWWLGLGSADFRHSPCVLLQAEGEGMHPWEVGKGLESQLLAPAG